MTTDTVTLFLALLAVAAQAAVAIVVVVWVAARWVPAAARARDAIAESAGPQALGLGALVAAVAMAGSLYLSEGAHFVPCKLCWYQRIAMYPLVPILGIAAWRRDLTVRPYVAVVAALGISISSYHVLLERYPSLESGACDPTNPCSLIWVERFGYLTIPGMAWSAFALILVLMALARRHPHLEESPA